MRNTINCTMVLMVVFLTHCVVNSLATLNAQSDNVTGMLATVMRQLAVVTENQAATNKKLDDSISTVTELQQTVARLTDRMSAVEELTDRMSAEELTDRMSAVEELTDRMSAVEELTDRMSAVELTADEVSYSCCGTETREGETVE